MAQTKPIVGRAYLLTYHYPDDWRERRMQYRDEHMALAREWVADERLRYAGVVGDPPTKAVVVFTVDSPEEVERFASADPYVREGIILDYTIEPWTVSDLS